MSEPVVAEVVTAEQTALVPKVAVDNIEILVKENDKAVYKAMNGMTSLDWKDLKPNQTAFLLCQKPIAVSGGGFMNLTYKQALYFAVRAYELGVSPFSPAVWFDPAKWTVNLTLEGKREVARNRGIDLGPPSFTRVERAWTEIGKLSKTAEEAKKAFPKDFGMTCKVRVGDPKNKEYSEYTAWLSEWYQPKSPLWNEKPDHMLQTRSTEKAITMALGTGASSIPDEREIS